MAKKKKNSNYGGAAPVKKAEQRPAPRGFQYGIPGWAVMICLALLVVALVLQPGVGSADWKNTLAYFLVGGPALVLMIGQRRVKQESGSKLAGGLTVLFAFIAALYLFSGITGLRTLLGA